MTAFESGAKVAADGVLTRPLTTAAKGVGAAASAPVVCMCVSARRAEDSGPRLTRACSLFYKQPTFKHTHTHSGAGRPCRRPGRRGLRAGGRPRTTTATPIMRGTAAARKRTKRRPGAGRARRAPAAATTTTGTATTATATGTIIVATTIGATGTGTGGGTTAPSRARAGPRRRRAGATTAPSPGRRGAGTIARHENIKLKVGHI